MSSKTRETRQEHTATRQCYKDKGKGKGECRRRARGGAPGVAQGVRAGVAAVVNSCNRSERKRISSANSENDFVLKEVLHGCLKLNGPLDGPSTVQMC